MTVENQIPKPIAFNPYKHHRNFILDILTYYSAPEFQKLLISVNDNYIDLYTGELSPRAICIQIFEILGELSINKKEFENWLEETDGFRIIKLSDQSDWIVRLGSESERFIHIHPAKTGAFTFRFKGTTLKTIYQFKFEFNKIPDPQSIVKVNQVRKEIGLSPVKKLEPGKGILRCWELMFENSV